MHLFLLALFAPGDIGGGRHAHTRADVAEVAGGLQQHDRRGSRLGEERVGIGGWAPRDRNHSGRGRQRRERREHLGGHHLGVGENPLAHIGRQRIGKRPQPRGRHDCGVQHLRAEAQRVLECVQTLEYREPGIAASVAEDSFQVGRGAIGRPSRRVDSLS